MSGTAAEVERLGNTVVWITGARQAHLTIAERVLAATDTPPSPPAS